MQNDILLSVIVPVYNCEKFLAACIESIIKQSYRYIEVILVDDGSNDSSGQLCDEFAKKDERIKVIHKQNEGACFARRDGIIAATAEYVTFVDGDDWIEPEMYQVLMERLLQNDADIVTSGFIRNEAGETIFDLIPEGVYEGERKENICNVMLYDRQYNTVSVMMSVCNKIYRKVLMVPYVLNLPPKLQLWEDITYVYPPFTKAKQIVITQEAFYHYRDNEASVSKKYDPLEFEKTAYTMEVARGVYQELGKNILESFDLECSQIFYRYLCRCINDAGNRYSDLKRLGSKLKEVSQDKVFKKSVGCVIDIIPSNQERKFLQLIIKGQNSKAIIFCKKSNYQLKLLEFCVKTAHQILGEKGIFQLKKILGKE